MTKEPQKKDNSKQEEVHQLASVDDSKTNDDGSYISNPFVIAFNGFSLLSKYAKGIFITLLVLGFLGTIGNLIPQSSSTSDNDELTTFISELETIQENPEEATSEVIKDAFNTSFNVESDEDFNIGAFLAIIVVMLIVFITVGLFIGTAISGVVAAGVVSATKEKEISIGEAFSQMADRFWTLFMAFAIATLRIIGGMFLFIIPGIRAVLRYSAVPYIVMMNPEMTATEAVNESKKLYKGHLMESLGINFTGSIPVVGNVLSAVGMGLSAKQLTEYDKAGKATPSTHWLNYLPLILLAGIFLLGVLVAIAFSV